MNITEVRLRAEVCQEAVCLREVCPEEACQEAECLREVCPEEVCQEAGCLGEVCSEAEYREAWAKVFFPLEIWETR